MSRLPLRLLVGLGIAALLVMVASTLVAVLARALGAGGFEWSYEVAGIAFIWTIFLGAVLAEARHENAAFEVVRAAAPRRWRRGLEGASALVLLIVGGALLASGLAALGRSGAVPTPLLRWPGAVQLLAPPLLGACLCVMALARLAGRDARVRPPATVGPDGAGTPL